MASKRQPRKQGQVAWLVTWEWCGDHAAVEDRVAAILRPRLSCRLVAEIVEHIYALHAYSPAELAAIAQQPRSNPYAVQWSDSAVGMCGGNPCLRVAKVRDLVIDLDPETQRETIRWTLPARYELDPELDRPRQARGPMQESAQRTISGPFSDREIGRFRPHCSTSDSAPTLRPS